MTKNKRSFKYHLFYVCMMEGHKLIHSKPSRTVDFHPFGNLVIFWSVPHRVSFKDIFILNIISGVIGLLKKLATV
jgi:hypothetical protein